VNYFLIGSTKVWLSWEAAFASDNLEIFRSLKGNNDIWEAPAMDVVARNWTLSCAS
jgi:hypothetical protein